MRHPSPLVSPEHCSQTTPISKFPGLCLYYSFMQESNSIAQWFPQAVINLKYLLLTWCCFQHYQNPRAVILPSPFSLSTKGHHNLFFISLYTPTQPGQTWCCCGVCVSHKRNSFAKEAPQIIAWGIKKRDLDPNSDLDVNTLWSKILELKIITAYCKHHCCFKNKSGWLESFHWKHFQIQNGSWIQYNFGKILGF